MKTRIRVDAAMALERLQRDLIEHAVHHRGWIDHFSESYYQLIENKPDIDKLRAAVHGFGSIPATDFKTASAFGTVLVSVSNLEDVLGIVPCPRLTGLGGDDRIKKIFNVAWAEFDRRAA